MHVEIEQKFKDLISKHFYVFNHIMRSGFSDELNFTADFGVRLKPLGHSVITNHLMIYNALQYADTHETFTMYRKGSTDYFCIRDEVQKIEVHGKILKLKRSLLSFVNETQQTLEFLKQEPIQYEFVFMPERINVILGYLPNESRTDVEIYITCPSDDKHLAWAIQVPKPEDNIDVNENIIPQTVPPNDTNTLVKRVQPIISNKKEQRNE